MTDENSLMAYGTDEGSERKTAVSVKMTAQTRDLFRDYVAGTGMTQEEAIKYLIEKAQSEQERPKTDLYKALTAELEPHLEAILNVLRTAYGATETAVLAEQQKAEATIQKVTAEKDSLLETIAGLKDKLMTTEGEISSFQQAVLDAQKKVESALDQQQKAEAREAEAKASLAENQDLTKSIREALEASQDRVKQLEAEAGKTADLEAQLEEARSQAQTERAISSELEKQAAISSVVMESMKEKLAKAELDLKQKGDDLAAYKRMYEECFTQLADTRRELSTAQREITDLTKQLKSDKR